MSGEGQVPENRNTLTRDELDAMVNYCMCNRHTINHCYNINGITDKTPLLHAIDAQDIDTVKNIIKMGVNLTWQVTKNYSPLCRAIQGNNFELVKYLVDIGTNTCYRGEDNKTPLYHAIRGKNLDIVRLLLDNGAKFTVTNGLVTAIKEGNLEIAKELLKYNPDVDWVHKGVTPLLVAVKSGYCDLVDLLAQHNATLEECDGCRYTPLQMAVYLRHINIVKYLLGKGAKVDETVFLTPSTPVQLALFNQDFDIFKVLVDAGAITSVEEVQKALLGSVDLEEKFVGYLMEVRPSGSESSEGVGPEDRE